MDNKDSRALDWVEQAVRDLGNLLAEHDPARRDILHTAGIVYSTFGKFEKALECHSECLELRRRYDGPLDVNTLHVLHLSTWALNGLGRNEDAVQLASEMLAGYRKKYGRDAKSVIWPMGGVILRLVRAGRLDEALSVAHQRMELSRTHSVSITASDRTKEATWALYSAFLKAGRNKQADEYLHELVETELAIAPHKSSHEVIVESLPYRCRATAATTRQAVRESLKVPMSIHVSTHSLCFLGELRILAGRADEALNFIERAIAEGGSEPFYYKSHGWALFAAGRREEARQAFEKAIGDVPAENADIDRLAAAYFLSKLNDTKFLELARKQSKTGVSFAWFYIGQKYAWDGDRPEAKEAFEAAVKEAEIADASGVVVNFAAVCRDLDFLDAASGEDQ
jgi:tetratricopeptide (TPR) repeat protein